MPTTTRERAPGLRAAAADPVVWLGCVVALVLVVLVLAPVIGLTVTTLRPDGIGAWADVLTGRLAPSLFHEPLANSLLVGTTTAVGSVLLGGSMAWLVVMTDAPARRTIALLATVPFALPSFALALAWETVFRNDLVGGRVGLLADLGVVVPDWIAWGPLPISATLVAHYYSLTFLLAAAALATVNGELMEAAEMTGASRFRVARSIALPVVAPALVSGGLLAFAEGVSNFASPALLGLPVRFQTLSTRLYGAISTGETARGYVLALLLIAVAATVLFASNRLAGGRRSYATITGKGGRRSRVGLGPWRVPLTVLAVALCLATTVLPGLVLLASSFARRTNSFLGGFTTHFWTGVSDPAIAQGQRGVLRNPQVVDAVLTTVGLGLAVAVAATVLGTAVGYAVVRLRTRHERAPRALAGALSTLSYLPFLIPGIALGAAFIAQFGRPIGPLPALYGTFALLVIAGAAYTLPFAAQAGRSAVGQIAPDVEEAAVMAGAGLARRAGRIVVPLAARGLLAGAVLVFVNIVRDLSLVVLLVTPATPLLSVLTYRYASEGFAQFANAITVIIVVISVAATVLARRLEGAAQPWQEDR
ncbi:iron ABC transporter permease [Pseudonocardia sp. MH-G8]|uniref:ABC transporter permease n=1 Tax=Pseudonocardia sp. MH-G8 TaxID=1854588 RepID=UPI001E5A4B6B|nr:iron ABC transporter permease [Pseudonocardia sp. MH-G8]